jgi:hypothetical protein
LYVYDSGHITLIYTEMPNHITSILHINGPRSDIDQIIGDEEDLFTFKYTVPHPPEATDDTWDWYSWQVENWGTKWDAYETIFSSNYELSDYSEITFQTAWSPPSAWLETTAEKFPNVEFKLYWMDEDYPTSGKMIASEGSVKLDEYYGNNQDLAKAFIEEYFPDTYEMHEKNNRLENLIEEVNENIQEEYPNVHIEVSSQHYDSDNDWEEADEFKISYIDTMTNVDVFNSLDRTTKLNIMKLTKKILSEHDYQTTFRGSILKVKNTNSDININT